MKQAESVTFGGSGLNRAAELRGDAEALAALLAAADTRVLPLWRGRILIDETGSAAGLVAPDHPLVQLAAEAPVFLGFDADQARFASEISAWEPEGFDAEAFGRFFDDTVYSHGALADGWKFVELRAVMARLCPRDAELLATAKAVLSWHANHGFCAKCGAESQVSQAGWQRDCPACGTSHFPRTDPVVIMLITHGNEVLLGRSPAWPTGMYSLLAGFVEPGETIEAAVRREVVEEAGIKVGDVQYLASQPWAFPSSLMFGCQGEALSRDITIDPKEIEDALWVSREDVMRAFSGDHPEILPTRKGSIAHFILEKWLADALD